MQVFVFHPLIYLYDYFLKTHWISTTWADWIGIVRIDRKPFKSVSIEPEESKERLYLLIGPALLCPSPDSSPEPFHTNSVCRVSPISRPAQKCSSFL